MKDRIRIVADALSYGMTPEEVHDMLKSEYKMSEENIYLTYQAGRIIYDDRINSLDNSNIRPKIKFKI